MKRIALPLFALALLTAGCRSTARDERHKLHDGTEVVIHDNHKHSKFCGHYKAADRWFYESRHRHGLSCGHVLEAGVWVLE